MVYIAGLDIQDCLRRSPLSHNQGVEGIVWLTTFSGFYRGVRHFRRAHKHAHRNRLCGSSTAIDADATTGISPPSGANIGDNVPKPLLARTLEPVVHGVLFIAPVTYLVGTAFGKLEQPEWFVRFALPDVDLTVGQFAALKTVACVANIAVQAFLKRVRKAIAAASESEKSTIPTEGPYSVIRHPLSVGSILSQATLAIMWWNAVPLATAALTGIYLASYTSYEEKRREKDLIHGAEYTEYKKRVTPKFIPGVW